MEYQINTDQLDFVFQYPESFKKLLDLHLVNFDYWYFMESKNVLIRIQGLKERYPKRQLIPFARRGDNDDIACFDAENIGVVHIIHDFASSGYEQRKTFDSLWDWLEFAVNELIERNKNPELL